MRRLSLDEILIAADIPLSQLSNLRDRKTLALAFGRNVASAALSYIELDALMLMVTNSLATSYSRKIAAQFCICHFDIIAQTLAEAEAHPELPQFLSVIDFFTRGVRSHTVCGTRTDDPELVSFELAKIPMTARAKVDRVTCINISALRAEAVANGERKGIDIAAPWLPPAGSAELAGLLAPYIETRDAAVATVMVAGAHARKAFEKMIPTGAAN